jgi:4-hydroxybenzoate polyprenyltransferase
LNICDLLPQENAISWYIGNELFSDNFAKIFCFSLSLLFISSYTLLTSHTHITLLLFITLFCQIFYVQTHNNTSILQSVLFVTAVKYK